MNLLCFFGNPHNYFIHKHSFSRFLRFYHVYSIAENFPGDFFHLSGLIAQNKKGCPFFMSSLN